jgi:hypothetical protein
MSCADPDEGYWGQIIKPIASPTSKLALLFSPRNQAFGINNFRMSCADPGEGYWGQLSSLSLLLRRSWLCCFLLAINPSAWCALKTTKPFLQCKKGLFCRGGRIRTYDLLLPKQARYRATLHPELVSLFSLS